MAIRRTVAELWRLDGTFSKWRSSAISDLLYACLDHPRKVIGGVYHCAKFGWNRFSNFDNMQVLIFNEFGLKMPIHAPTMFLGRFDP